MIRASEVKVREQTWLWFPYIPSHAATLIFGPGGVGKSHITVDIAACLSKGLPLPGQEMATQPQRVLMLSAEDEFDTVLVPRLIRQGANLEMIAFPSEPFTLTADGLKRLEEYVREFAATIIFIDPIVSYMGGKVDMFRANEVRSFMGPLQQLAVRTQTTIIIVGHSRKGDEGEDYERAMGSVDFANSVRSVLYATRAPDGQRILRHVKTNYAKEGPTLAFNFEDDTFQWAGAYDDSGMLTSAGTKRGKRSLNAVVFIKTILADGPVPAKEVELLAKDEGINKRTLARAKIGIAESYMVHEEGKPVWYWRLEAPSDDKTEVHGVDDRFGAKAGGGDGAAGAGDSPVDPGEGSGASGTLLKVGTMGPSPKDPREIAKDFLRARGIDPEAPENKGTWVGALANGRI